MDPSQLSTACTYSTHSMVAAGAGIDADIVFKVTTERDDTASPFGPVCLTAAAFAYAFFTEAVTGRPIYGVITLCQFDPAAFHRDLETMLHEMLHPLVRPPKTCPGPPNLPRPPKPPPHPPSSQVCTCALALVSVVPYLCAT